MNVWEIILCAFLGFFLAIVLGGLTISGVFRKRRLKEPPLNKGFIPWLGHGLDFRKNPILFLERMQKKHGDIFTVLLAGNYLHIVMDPHTFGTIIKESKDKLDYDAFLLGVALNVFGIQPTESQHKIMRTLSKKHLKSKSLKDLNQVTMEKLQAVLLPSQDLNKKERPWQEDGVFHFSFKTIFQASVMSLFGTEPGLDGEAKENAKESKATQWDLLFENFKKFDHHFPSMALDMLDPLSKKEIDSLRTFFWDLLSVEKIYLKDNISSWVAEQDQSMAEIGMTEKMRAQFQLLLLWGSQVNTGPATSWILVHLLKHPEALKAVREEVDRVIKATGQEVKPGGPFIQLSLDTIKTPFLDSAIEETLRLRATTFLFRSVVQDMVLRTANGREYELRKGDILLLVPFVGLNMDPEIYPDPQTFQYDRFVKPDGTKKEFYKGGKKLKLPTIPWGAGPSMCPGRFFAISELKLFVILMLSYFDMELVNPDEDIPLMEGTRNGFGVTPPTHDIRFRYRLKF